MALKNKCDIALFGREIRHVTIADKDLDLAQSRAQLWKQALQANLLKPMDKFNVKVALPTERGPITQIVLEITK